jgi:hypothetical protein
MPTCVPITLDVIKALPTQILCPNSVKYHIISLIYVLLTELKLLLVAMETKYFCSQILRINIVTKAYISKKLHKYRSNFGPESADLLDRRIENL